MVGAATRAGVLLPGLFLFCLRQPLQAASAGAEPAETSAPADPLLGLRRFCSLYGVVETMNGNWATLYMTNDLGATATLASVALTAFWGMVTVGRVLFAAIGRRFPSSGRITSCRSWRRSPWA